MQKYRISSLVVCRDGVPVGMVTDRDLSNKVVAQGLNISNLTIGEIMNSPLITILKDEFLFEALHRISRHGIHQGFRGCSEQVQYRTCTVVCHSGQSQIVPQPCSVADNC
jgi:hypothetical protein